MKLTHTEKLMKEKYANNEFDSYAVLVGVGDDDAFISSPNVDKDTYFDVASMGKVLVTSTLILRAVSDGLLSLDDTLEKFFPDVPEEKKDITLRLLLTHSSGIVRIPIPDRTADCGKEAVAEHILRHPLAYEPGTGYIYSCNGFILLGFILEKVFGMSLDEIYYKYITTPLGLERSRFNIAVDEENAAVCYRWKYPGKYRVDDENVYTLGGIAGNGASHSCAGDIQKFIKAVLDKDERLYDKELFRLAETNYTPDFGEGRGLGYLVVSEKYKQTGALFDDGSFGHCGHCGGSFFINRKKRMYVIILTNATRCLASKDKYGRYDYGVIMKMREDIHNAVKMDLDEQV
ncbi:MAG: beta-lactamase family protein [Clostridia bacterium]|nr:beta-lactamase family protein [Clostridia bacterium]